MFPVFWAITILHHSKNADWPAAILSAMSSISPPLPRSSSLARKRKLMNERGEGEGGVAEIDNMADDCSFSEWYHIQRFRYMLMKV